MNLFTRVTASQLGAILDCDINTGLKVGTGGAPTNNDAILNAFLALGTATAPVLLVMDGCTITAGIQLPAGGHAGIEGCGWDTGFYLATGTNRDVINNGGSALAIPSDPGFSTPNVPVPSTRGSNVSLRNFRVNGNSAGNSASYPADYFPMGINLISLNNCLVENVWIDNCAKYNLRFSNCGWCTVRGYRVTSTGAINTDGIHISGPGNNFVFDGCDIESGDDMIALNAPEGYCGTIDGVSISNCRGWGNSFVRAYTYGANYTGSAGPFYIRNVVIDNCTITISPTLGQAAFLIGFEGSMSVDAVRDLSVSNCVFTMTGSPWPILSLMDNVGSLKFSNCAWIAPVAAEPWISYDGYNAKISVVEFTGCSIYQSSAGSAAAFLMRNVTAGTLVIGSFSMSAEYGTTLNPPANLLSGCTIGAVKGTGVLATGYQFPDAQMANDTPYLSASNGSPSIKVNGNVELLTSSLIRLPRWDAARARVLSGTGQARVLAVGDSTTRGIGSNNSSSGNLAAKAYPTFLAGLLSATGEGAQSNAWSGGSPTDSRVSLGAWAGSIAGPGGALLLATSAATLTFSPTGPVDTFRIWYPTNGGLGSFAISIDGGAATTVSCSGSGGFASATIAASSPGTHTLSVVWLSGAAYICQVEASNSVAPYINVINMGWPGSTSANWNDTSTPFAPSNGVLAEAADLILLSLGINDWYNGGGTPIPVATYQANMQALITAWSAVSDIVLISPDPSQNSVVPLTTQAPYVQAMASLAAANNLRYIDNWTRWGSREAKSVAPYLYYFDGLHPDAAGYADFARGVLDGIR